MKTGFFLSAIIVVMAAFVLSGCPSQGMMNPDGMGMDGGHTMMIEEGMMKMDGNQSFERRAP
jgi:hypothetical protein